MASLDSFTRFVGRATSFVRNRRPAAPTGRLPRPLDRLPVRWRLAIVSAALTLVILMAFAVVIGKLTTDRIHLQFYREVSSTADGFASSLVASPDPLAQCKQGVDPAGDTVIRLVTERGTALCQTPGAPNLGPPAVGNGFDTDGYRVETRPLRLQLQPQTPGFPVRQFEVALQVARPTAGVEETVQKVRVFLAVGVLGGALLALLAGLAIARRAMSPIAELTDTARRIEATRDPSLRVPHPRADDEVAELARTLESMLAALDASRSETESALRRQREFVADASHELRTPLTSVLANLELLSEQLEGEPGETAGSAFRSAQRMRRLVADLLLLARADAGRSARREPSDLGDVVVEAAGELESVAGDHELTVDAARAPVSGARDELHRLALNLMENALRHTPPGTRVRVSTALRDGQAVLEVADDGPGVSPALAPRIFERFVRGGGESAGSSGLGLAIVRAVAEAHGGTVGLEPPPDGRGARFVVRLPALPGTAGELDDAERQPDVVA